MHERTLTQVYAYAQRHACFIPRVSVSVNRLTGNPVVSNVPRVSQLELIEFHGFCHTWF